MAIKQLLAAATIFDLLTSNVGLAQTVGSAHELDEIIVVATAQDNDLTRMAADAQSLLATPGDVNDPLKALLALPGITFGGSDLDAPVIRGGGPDDNIFLVDGIPVENVFHELSDSIISANVIRTFDLHSAAFGPAYGDATGGVIGIGLRNPDADNRYVKIDISQLKSGFLIETPVTGRLAAYVAYRHNLAHLFLEDFERGEDTLVFKMPKSRDYTGRIIWRGDRASVTFTALGAWDKTEDVPASNSALSSAFAKTEIRQLDTQALQWQSVINPQTDVTATLSHSLVNEDRREANGSFEERDATLWSLRTNLVTEAGHHKFTVGANLTHADNELSFRGSVPLCDSLEQNCGVAFSAGPAVLEQSFQTTELYFNDQIVVSNRFYIDLGLHSAKNHFLDENFIEPRLGANYGISNAIDIYARVGIHHNSPKARELLLLNALADRQESLQSRQIVLGQRWVISKQWRLQTEAWYKDFERKELIGSPLMRDLEGNTVGLDIVLARPISERLYGLVALSFSEGEQTDSASGMEFDNLFAPPVSITLAASYAMDNGWKVGAKYRGQSGSSYTPLIDTVFDPVTGMAQLSFGTPFSERLNDYHRVDIRVEKMASYRSADVTYYLDILNVTDRKNRANRRYPIRNTVFQANNVATVLPDDDEGIPLFAALGVNFSF